MTQFEGKVALVTGASRGVGRAVACALAGRGAAVGCVGRDERELAATVGQLTDAGGAAVAVRADVVDGADVERAVATVVDTFGGLDLLAHAAGVLRTGTVVEQAADDWDLVFATNTRSCFLLGKHAIPHLRARGGGAIVFVSSALAYAANPRAGAYAASKAAVHALTRAMALDHAGEGIRVNAVAPGSMRTAMIEAEAVRRDPADPAAVLAGFGRLHPIGRLVEVDEVASLVTYLLSDEASAITGSCHPVDGGRTAKLGTA